MRDVTSNPQNIIDDRKQSLLQKSSRENFRRPCSDDDLRFWLTNMIADHGFTEFEEAATGLSIDEIASAVERFSIQKHLDSRPVNPMSVLKVLPYPGGRIHVSGSSTEPFGPRGKQNSARFCRGTKVSTLWSMYQRRSGLNERTTGSFCIRAHRRPNDMESARNRLEPLEWTRENSSLRVEAHPAE